MSSRIFKTALAAISIVTAVWAAPTQVAVLQFTSSQSLSADEVSVINDRFETELNGTGAFKVLERRQMQSVLAEQGFQQSGACTDANCEVKMGQLLGVDRIITGSVGKVGELISMNLKMVDVATGEILASKALDTRGGMEGVLTEGCGNLARYFANPAASMQTMPAPVATSSVPAKSNETPKIESNKGSLAWLWWTLGGVAVVGGGVATWLLLQEDEAAAGTIRSEDRNL